MAAGCGCDDVRLTAAGRADGRSGVASDHDADGGSWSADWAGASTLAASGSGAAGRGAATEGGSTCVGGAAAGDGVGIGAVVGIGAGAEAGAGAGVGAATIGRAGSTPSGST